MPGLDRADLCVDWPAPMRLSSQLDWSVGGACGAVRAVEAKGITLGVLVLAQLRIQRDADAASGAGKSPSDIPVGDVLADGVLVGGSEFLAGSDLIEGNHELAEVLQDCHDLIEVHADLAGGHVHQPIQLQSWYSGPDRGLAGRGGSGNGCGKPGSKIHLITDRNGLPLPLGVSRRQPARQAGP